MSNNFYDSLGVEKHANSDDIKKAYRKMAMKYHPDRNKGDKTAEKKFKEINEAYGILNDSKKRKQYDTFGSTSGSPFGGGGGYSSSGFSGFEDMFGGESRGNTGGFNVDLEDLFGGFGGNSSSSSQNPFGGGTSNPRKKPQKQEENLDFEKTYEVPIFDLILGCSIEVSGVYGKKVKLKIPVGTISGTKFRVKGLGKSDIDKKGNLIVVIKSLMPKNISDIDKSMLERVSENVGY